MKQQQIASIIVAAVFLSVLFAYFGRPKAPLLELVSARQELPDLSEHLPGDRGLADRVTKSYGLALVLVRTPYAASNAIALESLRTWAEEHFEKEPGFLHPIALEEESHRAKTIIEAPFFTVGAYIYYGFQGIVGERLQAQIAQFHSSRAYNTFRTAYFDLFGTDADSAALMARYQSERAQLAVDVVLWSLIWVVAASAGLIYVLSGKPGTRFNRLRTALSYEWLLLASSYLLIAVGENQITMLISAVVAGGVGLFLRRPFRLTWQGTGELKSEAITMPSGWIAVALWLTVSLVTIQVLTWIRAGTLANPDPVTLLLSAISGDFLHDPSHGKRNIMRLTAVVWLTLSLWTARQSRRDAVAFREAEKALASLHGPIDP